MPPKSGKAKLTKEEKAKQKKEMEEKKLQEDEEARVLAEKEEQEKIEKELLESEERNRLEDEERKKRKGQLQELDDLWFSYRNTLFEEQRQNRIKAKWDRYLQCDGSPDPTIPGEINTYMNLWRENLTDRDIHTILQESNLMLSLMDELQYHIDHTPPEDMPQETVDRYTQTIRELRGLLKEKMDLASHDVTLKASEQIDSETLNLQQVFKNDVITLCVWGNLSKNPRIKSHEFEEVGFTFEMPKLLTLSDIAFRVMFTKFDHLSQFCKSFITRIKTETSEIDAAVASGEKILEEGEEGVEGVEGEKPEGEEGEAKPEEEPEPELQKEETLDVMSALNDLGDDEEEGEEKPEEEEVEEIIEEDVEIKTPEPQEYEDFDGDDDVIDLRAYQLVGGLIYFNLLNMPPQPHDVNNWKITQLVTPTIDYNDYQGDAPPLSPKDSVGGDSILASADRLLSMKMEIKKEEEPKNKAPEKPDIRITYKLPNNVLFSEEPQIVRWDEERECWTTIGFSDQVFNEEDKTYAFKTRFFGTLALVQDKHINMPFQSWEVRPRAANHVVMTIIAAIIEVELEIKDDMVRLTQPEDKPELKHLMDNYMPVIQFMQAMKDAGVNLFPDEDSNKYVSIQNKPNSITEERMYQQMAMTSSAMAYSWSRWNNDVDDVNKLVIQGCEQLRDEPLLEEDWSLFLVTKKRTTKLKMTEFDEAFSDDHAEGTEFHADLYHLAMEVTTEKGRERVRETNHHFVDTLYTILKATNLVTYS